MFWYEDPSIITLIIQLITYISGKSKHLIPLHAFSYHRKIESATNSHLTSKE